VLQLIETMGDVNASSHKIEGIIGVIDGMAYQAKILALNTAVEAERAAAREVRNLEQRAGVRGKAKGAPDRSQCRAVEAFDRPAG
jgi:methyl-accepting chemotaxis protein